MPEGDTVRRTARRLDQALSGAELTRSEFRVPAYATADLRGRPVLETVARGKHLLTRLGGSLTVHTHLRMEGSWRLSRSPEGRRGGPDWQIRLVLGTAQWQAVGYRLGLVELLPTAAEPSVVGHLGPDPLGPDWDPAEAIRRLTARPDREIGEALLDQRNLAGLGTLWRAEALFLAGVSPHTPAGRVPDLARLLELARRLLEAATRTGRQVTTGDPRPGQRSWVYGRTGRPCRRCGTPVLGAPLGPPPFDRPGFWCPRCQPDG